MIADIKKDAEGIWWVMCSAFPSSVFQAKDEDQAETICNALNRAYITGKNNMKDEIREARRAFLYLLAGPNT